MNRTTLFQTWRHFLHHTRMKFGFAFVYRNTPAHVIASQCANVLCHQNAKVSLLQGHLSWCVTDTVAAFFCILRFRGSVSRVTEQLCICLCWLRTANICTQCCIVRCASRLFEPTWPGQSAVHLSFFISFCLSFLLPLPFSSQHCCLEKLSSLCTLCWKREWSKGAHRGGEGERATDCSYCLRMRLEAS